MQETNTSAFLSADIDFCPAPGGQQASPSQHLESLRRGFLKKQYHTLRCEGFSHKMTFI